jgi:carboxymethylenebutenolidase
VGNSGCHSAAPRGRAEGRRRESVLAGACPIVGSHGARDGANRGTAERVDRVLEALRMDHDIKEYPGAGHSFRNGLPLPSSVKTPCDPRREEEFNGPSGLHEAPAADARRRIVSFFNHRLEASG